MNKKKMWKRFFSLDRHHAEGFTLVELIVVIAILAILAGVAVPAYSGYITKANESADLQNLSMLNNMFVVACIANNVDPLAVSAVEADWDAETKTFHGLSSVTIGEPTMAYFFRRAGGGNTPGEKVKDSFNGSMSGSVEFKILEQSEVEDGIMNGVETGAKNDYTPDENGNIKVNYGGGVIVLNEKNLEALKNTTFIESLGVDGLLDKISDVTGFAALMSNSSAMQMVTDSEAFRMHAASAMGVDTTKEGWEDELEAKALELAKELKAKNPDANMTTSAAANQILVNAAVLHAAKNATDETVMTKSDITNLLANEGASGIIKGNLDTNPSVALSQAAMAYGMYTAYAHSTGKEDLIKKTENPLDILNGLDDPDFQDWITKEQGQADLDGYLAAMEMINSSSEDTDAVSSLLVNGFSDPALKEILSGAMGN